MVKVVMKMMNRARVIGADNQQGGKIPYMKFILDMAVMYNG